MEEYKEDLSEQSMSIDNNTELDNFSNTLFGETVLCNSESLQRLPGSIYQLWEDYQNGKLNPVEPGDVTSLLQKWFNNEPISQFPTLPRPSDHGQQPGDNQKRRRVDGNI